MKSFLKTIGAPVASCVLAFGLVACGETESSSTSASASIPAASVVKPPAPVIPPKWDSDSEKAALEDSIMNNAANAFTGTESKTASVTCKATTQKNIWHCDIRDLGDEEPTPYRIEYVNGTWAGKPIM